MTLPYEEVSALKSAREFLVSLLDPRATPKVPFVIRSRARQVLRHYPFNLYIDTHWRGGNWK